MLSLPHRQGTVAPEVATAPTEPKVPSYHEVPVLDWLGLRQGTEADARDLLALIDGKDGYYREMHGFAVVLRITDALRTQILRAHLLPPMPCVAAK